MAASKREKPDLQKKVHEVPHKPGVYLMRDRFNRVIYVGKARDLRKRVSSYFLPSKLAQADLKTRAMLEATWDFETHVVRSEAESVLLEGKLIKEYRPRYNISFRDDKRFLREMIEALDEEMRKAAETMDFEKAAELRNMIDDVRQTTRQTRRFTRGTLPSAIDPLADVQALGDALQLPRLPRVMECFDISNISTTHVVASMVCFRDGVPDKNCYRRYRVRTVEGQDDFASMAEVVRRRYSRVLLEARERNPEAAEFSQEETVEGLQRLEKQTLDPPPQGYGAAGAQRSTSNMERKGGDENKMPLVRLPDLIIVDGGKGQLSSACRELQRLGLHELPIIGLAKEHEEIYRPSRALPLQLPIDSGALRLLQRIRDEAHRFANTYHQLLMKKRIGESILDDCPGVSQNRKNLLLRKFGSMNRLRKATVEQIAATEGIGPKLAEEVHRFLQKH